MKLSAVALSATLAFADCPELTLAGGRFAQPPTSDAAMSTTMMNLFFIYPSRILKLTGLGRRCSVRVQARMLYLEKEGSTKIAAHITADSPVPGTARRRLSRRTVRVIAKRQSVRCWSFQSLSCRPAADLKVKIRKHKTKSTLEHQFI